jgi:hypothetical protein
MATVYSINNEIFATKCVIFGWSIDVGFGYQSLQYGDAYDLNQLKEMRKMFSGILYPDELRTAIDTAIVKIENGPTIVAAPYSRSEIDADMDAMEKDFEEDRKPKVKMKDFKIPGRTYPLVNWCTHGDDMWKLMQRFGSSWSKVPERKDIRYIRDKTRKIQFIMRLDEHGDPVQFELYQGMAFAEFKEAVENGSIENKTRHVYMTTDMDTKSGELVINALMLNTLW